MNKNIDYYIAQLQGRLGGLTTSYNKNPTDDGATKIEMLNKELQQLKELKKQLIKEKSDE